MIISRAEVTIENFVIDTIKPRIFLAMFSSLLPSLYSLLSCCGAKFTERSRESAYESGGLQETWKLKKLRYRKKEAKDITMNSLPC